MIRSLRYLILAIVTLSPLPSLADQTAVTNRFLDPMHALMRHAVTPASYSAVYSALRARTLTTSLLVRNPKIQKIVADHFGKIAGCLAAFAGTWVIMRVNRWCKDRRFDTKWTSDTEFRKRLLQTFLRQDEIATIVESQVNYTTTFRHNDRSKPILEFRVSSVQRGKELDIYVKDLITNKTWILGLQRFADTTQRSQARAASSSDGATRSIGIPTRFADQLAHKRYGWSAARDMLCQFISKTRSNDTLVYMVNSRLVPSINLLNGDTNDIMVLQHYLPSIMVTPFKCASDKQTIPDANHMVAAFLDRFYPNNGLLTTDELLALSEDTVVKHAQFRLSPYAINTSRSTVRSRQDITIMQLTMMLSDPVKWASDDVSEKLTDSEISSSDNLTAHNCIRFRYRYAEDRSIMVYGLTEEQFKQKWHVIKDHMKLGCPAIRFDGDDCTIIQPENYVSPVELTTKDSRNYYPLHMSKSKTRAGAPCGLLLQ